MIKNDNAEQELESPVFASMASRMKFDFVFNNAGAWLFHDKPLPAILKWVEYDVELEQVVLIFQEGRLQPIGLRVPAEMGRILFKVNKATVMYMLNDKIDDFAIVPLIARAGLTH